MVNEINPEYSLEGLMLKLKLQSFGHLMGRAEHYQWRQINVCVHMYVRHLQIFGNLKNGGVRSVTSADSERQCWRLMVLHFMQIARF